MKISCCLFLFVCSVLSTFGQISGGPRERICINQDWKAYNGLALVIVRLKPGTTGPVPLRARSAKLASAEISIRNHP